MIFFVVWMEEKQEGIARAIPLFSNGKFSNPGGNVNLSLERFGLIIWIIQKVTDLLKWTLTRDRAIFPTMEELERKLPILKPDKGQLDGVHDTEEGKAGVQTTWIGHSTFLVQMEGCNILTDPVFYLRCSPISFLGPKRYREAALEIDTLPNIDAVVGK